MPRAGVTAAGASHFGVCWWGVCGCGLSLVPPVGLEPTTFGLKAPAPSLADRLTAWAEHIGVLATHWLTARAAASRQTLPHELRQLGRLAIPEPTPPLIPYYRDPAVGRLPLD